MAPPPSLLARPACRTPCSRGRDTPVAPACLSPTIRRASPPSSRFQKAPSPAPPLPFHLPQNPRRRPSRPRTQVHTRQHVGRIHPYRKLRKRLSTRIQAEPVVPRLPRHPIRTRCLSEVAGATSDKRARSRKRLGTPASAGTRCARAQRNRTTSPSVIAHPIPERPPRASLLRGAEPLPEPGRAIPEDPLEVRGDQ